MIEPNITIGYLNRIKVFAKDKKWVFCGNFQIYGKAQKDTERIM
jgi:hypothetical protein